MGYDYEAAAKKLFELTFKNTLDGRWEDQPQAFRDDYTERARQIVEAALGGAPA